MTVATTKFGTFKVHIGTSDEVATAMTGKNMKNGSRILPNGVNYTGFEVI